jgi:hypothetical protein
VQTEITEGLMEFFYRWRKAQAGQYVAPPPAHLLEAMEEGFYWGEKLENGVTYRDVGYEPAPGVLAAVDAFWRGRNKADNEKVEAQQDEVRRANGSSGRQQQQQQRSSMADKYKGRGD